MYDVYANNPAPTPAPAPAPQKVLRFDRSYAASLPGVLKGVQLLCNVSGLICLKVSTVLVSAVLYNLVYWVCMLATLFLLLSYSFHVVEKWDRWPWLKGELLYCAGAALVYAVLAVWAAATGDGGYAVGFFGLCAIIAYGFDGFLKYKAWKRGLPPQ